MCPSSPPSKIEQSNSLGKGNPSKEVNSTPQSTNNSTTLIETSPASKSTEIDYLTQKQENKAPIHCLKCGTVNFGQAIYCVNCGEI